MTSCGCETVNDRFSKDPQSDLDYTEDWSKWLSAGDKIASASWTVPAGLNHHSESFNDDTTTLWLSGGTLGEDYDVTTQITTAQGRVEQKTQNFRIRSQ